MQAKFNEIVATGKLFTVDANRDEVWQTYLNAFSEDKKQENTCNCCKSFIRQYGSIVGINSKNEKITLWDFVTTDEEYAEPIKALSKYIKSLPITGIFFAEQKKCGVEKNPDSVRGIIWDHYNIVVPETFVKKDSGPLQATALDSKNVLQRSLTEITDDAVDTVLELIAQGSLYRGEEHKKTVSDFRALKNKYKLLKNTQHKDNFCWIESAKVGGNVSRIRNTSIGTLLNDLSEGKELDKAVSAFERVVAPTNYKRPTALVTPRMISDAQKTLEELGLTGSLYRRMLSTNDLNVNNSLFVYRPKKVETNIFDELKNAAPVNPKSFAKVEEVSISDFVEKILPTCKSVKVLVENNHLGNFVSLVGPKNIEDTETLFKWGNNFSWSYSGNVADSIKERVKAAGGNVDGVMRISLSWDNTDDLDLHLQGPNREHVYYSSRHGASGATLDVDANGLDGIREDPVENIYWKSLPKDGDYKVVVNNYNKRSASNQGYTLEIEYDGQTYHWSSETNNAPNKEIISFNFSKKTGIKFSAPVSASVGKYNSKDKWGVPTGVFHNVKAVTLSPNFWNAAVGNKHFFFMLDECKSDEKTRGIYNEFLDEKFSKHRKVFEILGSKVAVEPVNNELSGLGFSDTIRTELVAEIEGKFRRTIKIKF